jgi:hypothetical protein
VKVAHDAIISQFKVNFANIPASRLVAKLRDDSHNCWGDCAANAAEMQAAIEEWHEAIKDSAPAPTDGGSTTAAPVVLETSESRALATELADTANPLKSNTVKLNTEAAMLNPPMVRKADSNGTYFYVPNNGTNTTLAATATTGGKANMNFKVPYTGSYRVFALVSAPNGNDNSMFVSIPGANVNNRVFEPAVNSKPEWNQVPNTFNLTAGTPYTIEFKQREDGFMVYSVIVTADPAFDGIEVENFFGVTLSFDVSQILKVPGSVFKIDVSDFDLYTYKFSRPRVVSSADVHVKDVKILVNGVYNPQHSTYTVVDTVIKSGANESAGTGYVKCADEGGTCAIPAGAQYEVLYGVMGGGSVTKTLAGGQSVGCNNGIFTDPAVGMAKSCYYKAFDSSFVSDYAMLVIKDKGPTMDKIKFSFGALEVAGGGTAGTTGGAAGGTGETSLTAFAATVYPISRTNCLTCHRTQYPQHSSDNLQMAHDSLVVGGFINFTNPENSKLVQKMRANHNCGSPSQCSALGDAYRNAITEWQRRRP